MKCKDEDDYAELIVHPLIERVLKPKGWLEDFDALAARLGFEPMDLAADISLECNDKDMIGWNLRTLRLLGFTLDQIIEISEYKPAKESRNVSTN